MKRASALVTALLAVLVPGCTERAAMQDDDGATSGPVDSVLTALHGRADSLYLQEGDYEGAAALYAEALELARRHDLPSLEARALTRLGMAAYWRGDYALARSAGEQALTFKLEHELTDQLWASHNALGLLAWNENRFDDALVHYGRAEAVARETGDLRWSGTTSINLGLVQTDLGLFSEARASFARARTVLEEVEDDRNVAAATLNQGMLEVRVGDPARAVPLLEESLSRFREISYPTGVSFALGHLGTAYAALGQPARAFAALDSALELSRAQGLRQDEASDLEILAEQYRAAGDYTRALDLYEEAKVINAELGLSVETGSDLRGEAEIHRELGDAERARSLVLEARLLHRDAGARLEELYDLLLLAELENELDDSPQAARTLTAAILLADSLGVASARVATALTQARVALARGEPNRVLESIDRIEGDLPSVGYAGEAEAHLLRARAYRSRGQIVAAVAAGRQAVAAVERVRGNYGSAALRTSFTADRRDVYTELVSTLVASGAVDEALGVADAARGRAVLESVTTEGSGPDLARANVTLHGIDQLVQTVDMIQGDLDGSRPSPAQVRELDRLHDRLDSLRSAYERQLVVAQEAEGATATMGDWPVPSVSETNAYASLAATSRNALDADEAILSYLVPPNGPVLVFVVTRRGTTVVETPLTEATVSSRVRLARDLIGRGADADPGGHAVFQGLFDALIRPARDSGALAGVTRLAVVPHHGLTYLPFAALRNGDTGRYLVEDYEIRTLSSVGLIAALAGQPGRTGAQFGRGAAFAPFPRSLPASAEEATRVAATFDDGLRFLGPDATEAALREQLGSSAIVHVATHGVMNAENPLFTRIVLAPGPSATDGTGRVGDDGRLEVHEVLSLNVRASLVFLSGCETAMGRAGATRYARGEDFATLSQALLQRGARNVVATLWPVEDQGAAVFAERFYAHLPNVSPARALTVAQREMLSDERFRSPYFWAAYQVSGDDGGLQVSQTP